MAERKDFDKALKGLVETYQDNDEPGFRYAVVSELRTLADYIAKSDPWPAEIKASEEAQKKGLVSVSEPTEAEMKRAAADEEAAALARMRGIGDDYTSKGAEDVSDDAKNEKLVRDLALQRGDDSDVEVPGRPFPARTPQSDDVDVDKRTHADVSTDEDPTSSPASRRADKETKAERDEREEKARAKTTTTAKK